MSEPLDSRQLQAFVTLAKTGSYTETARQLFVTHSAISHSMRALETNAGCRLLSKMGKTVALTEAGEALLQHARQVLEEMRQARLTLEGLNKWGCHRLRLGAEAALEPLFLGAALIQFHQEFPRLLLGVEWLGGAEARTLLETNRADLVLAEKSYADDRFDFLPLFSEVSQFVVGPGHPWAGRTQIPREELGRQPCLLPRLCPPQRRRLEEYLGKDGVVLNPLVELDSVTLVKDFLRQSPSMAVLPAWVVRAETRSGELTAFALGRRPPVQTWGCLHWRGRPLNHGEATFLLRCRERLAAAGLSPAAD